MKPKKYLVFAQNNDGPMQKKGGAWFYDEPLQIVVSSEELLADTTERYFLKSCDPTMHLLEFFVTRELTSGNWGNEPPPHFYEIKLGDALVDKA